jgi:hypothetical protein
LHGKTILPSFSSCANSWSLFGIYASEFMRRIIRIFLSRISPHCSVP